jgi:hypothetical protein
MHRFRSHRVDDGERARPGRVLPASRSAAHAAADRWTRTPAWSAWPFTWSRAQKNPGEPGFSLCAEGDLNPHPQ